MVKRSAAMLLLGMVLVGLVAGPATATEAGENFREYEEIQGDASDVGSEFLPEEYEIPGFFDWLIIPLVALGVVVTGVTLFRYLIAQPRFEREAEKRSRR